MSHLILITLHCTFPNDLHQHFHIRRLQGIKWKLMECHEVEQKSSSITTWRQLCWSEWNYCKIVLSIFNSGNLSRRRMPWLTVLKASKKSNSQTSKETLATKTKQSKYYKMSEVSGVLFSKWNQYWLAGSKENVSLTYTSKVWFSLEITKGFVSVIICIS